MAQVVEKFSSKVCVLVLTSSASVHFKSDVNSSELETPIFRTLSSTSFHNSCLKLPLLGEFLFFFFTNVKFKFCNILTSKCLYRTTKCSCWFMCSRYYKLFGNLISSFLCNNNYYYFQFWAFVILEVIQQRRVLSILHLLI